MSLSAPVRDEEIPPEMLADPRFEAIWQTIKSWDVRAPWQGGGYSGATGTHARVILEALTTSQVEAGEVERLNGWLAETQMLAHKWMVAHDKLKAGEPYNLPKSADLPDAITVLLDALTDAREAVASLDEGALGWDREHGYPYRDELLAKLDAALVAQSHGKEGELGSPDPLDHENYEGH